LNVLKKARLRLGGGCDRPTIIEAREEYLQYTTSPENQPRDGIPFALWPAVVQSLASAKIPCARPRRTLRPLARAESDTGSVRRVPAWLPQLVRLLEFTGELMLVRGRLSPSPQEIILRIAAQFPTAQIAIVSESAQTCEQIVNALRLTEPDTLLVRGGGFGGDLSRIVVGTWLGGHAGQQFSQRDLVIFPDCRHAIGERGRWLCRFAPQARFIAMCEAEDRFSRYERDWLTAIFGFRRLELPLRQNRAIYPPQSIQGAIELYGLVQGFLTRR